MQQAKDLAADFQRQLAGKSNEFAQLKQLFEKAQADLTHLQEGIVELRAERHRFANESMRATAYQAKLAQVTGERDRLRVELEHVRRALNQSATEMQTAIRDRDAQIAVLVVELVTLKDALEVARKEAAVAKPVHVLRSGPLPEDTVVPVTEPVVVATELPVVAPKEMDPTALPATDDVELVLPHEFLKNLPKRPIGEDMLDPSFGR